MPRKDDSGKTDSGVFYVLRSDATGFHASGATMRSSPNPTNGLAYSYQGSSSGLTGTRAAVDPTVTSYAP